MIELSFQSIEELDKTEQRIRRIINDIKKHVKEQIETEVRKEVLGNVRNYIYSEVVKRTGMLGRSFVVRNKVEEDDSFYVSVAFNKEKAPHVETHIGDESITIVPTEGHKWLTIPVGRIADVYYNKLPYSRPRVADFEGIKVARTRSGPVWYLGKRNKDGSIGDALFVGKSSVTIRQRVSLRRIDEIIYNSLLSSANLEAVNIGE
ncbi:MAG TPA: hypothetical protein PLU14_00300 [Caldisericia bacterium]|nr:hypothetical protein [Caldisericia bacterium]